MGLAIQHLSGTGALSPEWYLAQLYLAVACLKEGSRGPTPFFSVLVDRLFGAKRTNPGRDEKINHGKRLPSSECAGRDMKRYAPIC